MKESFCSEPSDREIREGAYFVYLTRGCTAGRDLENWLEAERLLRLRRADPAREPGGDDCLHFPLNAGALRVDTPHPFPLR
jgi:hypothetical protein